MKTSSSASGTFIVFHIIVIGDIVFSQRRGGGMETEAICEVYSVSWG